MEHKSHAIVKIWNADQNVQWLLGLLHNITTEEFISRWFKHIRKFCFGFCRLGVLFDTQDAIVLWFVRQFGKILSFSKMEFQFLWKKQSSDVEPYMDCNTELYVPLASVDRSPLLSCVPSIRICSFSLPSEMELTLPGLLSLKKISYKQMEKKTIIWKSIQRKNKTAWYFWALCTVYLCSDSMPLSSVSDCFNRVWDAECAEVPSSVNPSASVLALMGNMTSEWQNKGNSRLKGLQGKRKKIRASSKIRMIRTNVLTDSLCERDPFELDSLLLLEDLRGRLVRRDTIRGWKRYFM